MEDLICGADSFAKFMRYTHCSKLNQTLQKSIYTQKIWGAQLKGGLEVCDAILFENKDLSFSSTLDIETRYKNLIYLFKIELGNDIDILKSFTKYAEIKSYEIYGGLKKTKINANIFEDNIRRATLRGSLVICEKLLAKNNLEPTDSIDVMLGDIHISRMELWNEYASSTKGITKLDVTDTMHLIPQKCHFLFK
jgi:hypothetical protein